MKKLLSLVLAVVIMLPLVSCSTNIEFDKDKAISRAEQAVQVINTRDYDATLELFREDLRSNTTADNIKSAWDSQLEEAGVFVNYISESAGATKQSGTDYIVVVLVSEYQNDTLTYTISMDLDMNIVGMYMK